MKLSAPSSSVNNTTAMAAKSTATTTTSAAGCASATMFLSTKLTTSPKPSNSLEKEDYLEHQDINKIPSSSKKTSKKQKIRMPQRKGGMQLWQFLYALLEDPTKRYGEMIEWTDNRKELEFRLINPEAIAIWWGNIKHRANMTYERLSRSLRYYYDRGILKKMGGERYLYRFCVDPEEMYKHIGNSDSRPILKPMPVQVTKWMYSHMMMPHGVFFPTKTPSLLAPPDYSAAVLQQQQSSSLYPPPPPYLSSYTTSTEPQFYLSACPPISYDYLTHFPSPVTQETTETSTYRSAIHYEPQTVATTFQEVPATVPISEPLFIATDNTSTHGFISTTPSLCPDSPPSERQNSYSNDMVSPSIGYQFNFYPHLISTSHSLQQQQSDTSTGLYYDAGGATSPLFSADGSTCSGGDCEMALDEILPILASMEQSDELLSSSRNSSLSGSPPAVESPSFSSSIDGSSNSMGYLSHSSYTSSNIISTHYSSPTYTNHTAN